MSSWVAASREPTRWWKTLCVILPSKITIDSPANTLDTRNRIGINSGYHSGCTFSRAIRKSAPSPDWCRMERVMPKITAPAVSPPRIRRTRRHPSHSATAGENSRNSAVM